MSEEPVPDRDRYPGRAGRGHDPRAGQGLTAAGLVRGLAIRGGRAAFMLEVPAADIALYAPVREAAERALAAVAGRRDRPGGADRRDRRRRSLKVTPRRADRARAGGPAGQALATWPRPSARPSSAR